MGTTEGTATGESALAARYSEAFAAYLSDRGEQALGAAYDLGREAVAAQLSVMDLAEAHHAALRRVELEHRDLPEPRRAEHVVGWRHYLARLALEDPGPDPGMPVVPPGG